jgi:hypothetical protein
MNGEKLLGVAAVVVVVVVICSLDRRCRDASCEIEPGCVEEAVVAGDSAIRSAPPGALRLRRTNGSLLLRCLIGSSVLLLAVGNSTPWLLVRGGVIAVLALDDGLIGSLLW